jgi:hypothetical protein
MRCRVPALLRQRLEDGLPDPPDRVGDELDALGLVELVSRADEAEVALVDQVGERDTLVLVLLGHRDDEAEVAADQLVEGLTIAGADPLGEADLLLLRNQRVLADLTEILVQGSLVERRTPPARTDLHWTHATRPRTEHGERLERRAAMNEVPMTTDRWTATGILVEPYSRDWESAMDRRRVSSAGDWSHNSTVSIWARCSRPE